MKDAINNARDVVAVFLMGLVARLATRQYREMLAQYIQDGISLQSGMVVTEDEVEEWVTINT